MKIGIKMMRRMFLETIPNVQVKKKVKVCKNNTTSKSSLHCNVTEKSEKAKQQKMLKGERKRIFPFPHK